MPDRQPTNTIQIKLRVRESLRAALAKEARTNERTLNAEIAHRLQRSFYFEEQFGGPEVAQMARMMASAFLIAGQRAAAHHGLNTAPRAWITDATCYRHGFIGVVEVLHALDVHGFNALAESMTDDRKLKSYLDRVLDKGTSHE